MPANSEFNYQPFLKKAYLDPIRTVTVIDDEYPTLDELLEKGKEDFRDDDLKRLKEIIQVSRRPEYNWLLDVYNGQTPENISENVASRLFHSDLLILDYHLDGEDSGHCEKTLKIIRELADNRHFNIVAVHTKGYQTGAGSVDEVFTDIIISLQQKPRFLKMKQDDVDTVENVLDEWELDFEDIRKQLLNSMSVKELLFLAHQYNGNVLRHDLQNRRLEHFQQLVNDMPQELKIEYNLLVKWLYNEKLKPFDDLFAAKTYKHFDWGEQDGLNWIKTEDLFLTVFGKKQTPVAEIPEKLLQVLQQWNPHPHKLILTKLRNEVETNGIAVFSDILDKKHLQAAWLKELIKEDISDADVKTRSWSVINKLWEEFLGEVKSDMNEFAFELVSEIRTLEEPLKAFVDEETLADDYEQLAVANSFACSKKVTAHHLITGHVLKKNNEYLLCLSPICDLVPGQKSESSLVPITLVKMHDAREALRRTRETAIKEWALPNVPSLNDQDIKNKIMSYATQNNLIFIRPDNGNGEVKVLSFTVGLDGKSAPKAQEYHVEDQGQFDQTDRSVKLHHAKPGKTSSELETKVENAEVVAELRYEYALNLLQRLGFSRSRVGLDFVRN